MYESFFISILIKSHKRLNVTVLCPFNYEDFQDHSPTLIIWDLIFETRFLEKTDQISNFDIIHSWNIVFRIKKSILLLFWKIIASFEWEIKIHSGQNKVTKASQFVLIIAKDVIIFKAWGYRDPKNFRDNHTFSR